MKNNNPVTAEDVLPDGVDTTTIDGKILRKGTITAFLLNLEILENPEATEPQKQAAVNMMKELAPTVINVGLHKHVVFKNSQAEKILIDTKENLK